MAHYGVGDMSGRPRKADVPRHTDGRIRQLATDTKRRLEMARQVDALRTRLGLGSISPREWDLLITIADELRRLERVPEPLGKGKAVEPKRHSTEKPAKYQRAWRAANAERARERSRVHGAKRRAKMKLGMRDYEVREWAGGQEKVCRWCGADCSTGFHVDHVVPLSRGGSHERRNLCISCRKCNLSKGAKDPAEFELKILLAKEAGIS